MNYPEPYPGSGLRELSGVCLPALWVSWVMVQAESAWGPDGDMEEEPARSGRLKSQM